MTDDKAGVMARARLRASGPKTKTVHKTLEGEDLVHALRAQAAIAEIAQLQAQYEKEKAQAIHNVSIRYAAPVGAAEQKRDEAIKALGLGDVGPITLLEDESPPALTYEVPDEEGAENGADVESR